LLWFHRCWRFSIIRSYIKSFKIYHIAKPLIRVKLLSIFYHRFYDFANFWYLFIQPKPLIWIHLSRFANILLFFILQDRHTLPSVFSHIHTMRVRACFRTVKIAGPTQNSDETWLKKLVWAHPERAFGLASFFLAIS
jgi:hypothetical protein